MGLHPSHKTRYSDASSFDEICVYCGHTDQVPGGWGKLAEPCPNAPKGEEMSKVKPLEFTPMWDRVAIEPDEPTAKSSGGLYIPENAKEKPVTGTVVAIGPARGDEQVMLLKIGDKVSYGKYAGTEIEVHGRTVVVVKETDVLGRID